MKKIVLAILVLSLSVFAGQINIAVAANVSYAIDDLIKEFNKTNPDTQVLVTLGSTGKLTAQIKNGAPYNILMGANMKYPQALFDEQIAITKPVIYAQGSLAILSNSKKYFEKGIALTDEASIKKIAIANPKTAPYGKAAVEAMKNGGVLAKVENKFVYAESISQTVTYALTAADLGFIAKSSLYSPKMAMYKKGINWVDVDSKLYTPINQGIVIIKNAQDNQEVRAFYDFILGEKAKAIFTDFGYLVP
ncbi:MAG: molybdate ABC transporter substrate-binding protein [Candidatus Marinarcus sp.]|uniref:molybdate ABC transporter substrate-binding protein n=1 Tax=Candidatus Marinarcus sp. TaxID=3100987 RepID=UPI003B00100B